jgi:hypothetical protein
MRLKVSDLSDFRRRRARQVVGAPAPATPSANEPVRVQLRTRRTEQCDVIVKIRDDQGEALDAEQARELGWALIRAAAERGHGGPP